MVKLVFTAPASFLSDAWVLHDVVASVWHFFMKLVRAAPASFLSEAWLLHVGFAAAGAAAGADDDGAFVGGVCASVTAAKPQSNTANSVRFMLRSSVYAPAGV